MKFSQLPSLKNSSYGVANLIELNTRQCWSRWQIEPLLRESLCDRISFTSKQTHVLQGKLLVHTSKKWPRHDAFRRKVV